LGIDVGAWPSETERSQWMAKLTEQYEIFADALGERLPAHRRALYERLFADTPGLASRFRSRRHMTLIQGDSHVWNCFLPKHETGTARLFDWDSWRPAIGTGDLAYMIAMHWYPELRGHAEQPLLDAFHEELLACGVAGYDRRALHDDYRLSVLWETT